MGRKRPTRSHKRPQCGRFFRVQKCVMTVHQNAKLGHKGQKSRNIRKNPWVICPISKEERVLKQGKTRFALWINSDSLKRVQEHYREDNCKTQSEFIERAINFYCGYLETDKTGSYLPPVLASTFEGILLRFGDRLGRLLFKLTVEVCMLTRIIAAESDISADSLAQLRAVCIQDIKRTNGQLSFRDILRLRDES